MALLRDILYNVPLLEVFGTTDREIASLSLDSRKLKEGGLFAAIRGTQSDGHLFMEEAVKQGAAAILCEQWPEEKQEGVTYLRVRDSAAALGIIASNFYGNPSEHLNLIAVTGTNGKTTVSHLLYQLFERLGYKAGLLGTIENRIHKEVLEARLTTPDVIELNRLLARMLAEGCSYAFMEASSIAIEQKRMAGLQLKGALFTNITHDHLDYHGSFDAYIKSKKLLFDSLPSTAFALINNDDKRASVMVQNCNARVWTYGLKRQADFRGRVLENDFSGLQMIIDQEEFHTPLIGYFNAYNLLAAYATAILLGVGKMETLAALSLLKAAAGRFEVIRSADGIIAIVDYAHTPDALKNVLQTINSIRSGNEELISVLGAGGQRDREKRPVMAEVAARLSKKVILTSDNPRNEDPEAIIEDMLRGVLPPYNTRVISIKDRREAIRTAVMMARPGDIILVAGKGHENYQEIGGKRFPFDDKVEVMQSFKQLKN